MTLPTQHFTFDAKLLLPRIHVHLPPLRSLLI
jgi:hypothetical protein